MKIWRKCELNSFNGLKILLLAMWKFRSLIQYTKINNWNREISILTYLGIHLTIIKLPDSSDQWCQAAFWHNWYMKDILTGIIIAIKFLRPLNLFRFWLKSNMMENFWLLTKSPELSSIGLHLRDGWDIKLQSKPFLGC